MSKHDKKKPVPIPVASKDYNLYVVVLDEDGKPITNAHVVVACDDNSPVMTGVLDTSKHYRISVPSTVAVGWGASVAVSAEGFQNKSVRFVLPFDATGKAYDEELPFIHLDKIPEVIVTDYPFPNEAGRLTVDKQYFRVEQRELWQSRACTLFLLFFKFMRGESILPQLDWMRLHGFNEARVFGPVEWDEVDFKGMSDDDFVKLDNFFTVLADFGLRCEWVPITYRFPVELQQRIVNKSYEVANKHWNVRIEICNEPLKDGKCNPVELVSNVPVINTLTSYGMYPTGDEDINTIQFAHYCTTHTSRDYPKFSRNSKDVKDLSDATGKPAIDNEPIGVAESDQSERRTTNLQALLDHFAILYMYTSGGCYHFEEGIHGNIPAEGSVQDNGAKLLTSLFKFIPEVAQAGEYSRPGYGPPFPVLWEESDSLATHVYAVVLPGLAYVVNPIPRDGWEFIPTNGYTKVVKLTNSIARIER